MSEAGGERPFLSIGEVLDQLKVDFPDVTISKIRFLESQGLVDPERTPSGYRKFYEGDVARLRWILRQQREHFLPLKVIKDRLEREGEAALDDEMAPTPAPAPAPAAPAAAEPADAPAEEAVRTDRASSPTPRSDGQAAPGGGPDILLSGMSSATFTREELASASGCDEAALADLERYGLLVGKAVGGSSYFDEESLIVARLAAAFARHGVEARHLRMYKTAAEREAGFFQQVVLPGVKQRDPAGRRQSLEALADLVRLGEGLRGSILRQALRPYVDGA
ncbi:MAG: transcriptional regulator, MerR family [uncultured Acidimicrobiales bacterium]|uniref:Transcriptional regulator, MerR family n=1 Tax=uncultured Acidimicrobiales bacterium TaxID=310071 RepID=A0A6J4HC14_9ACTN|nr:MAG: transcriptional regulator, MerR family [uncultured Acidimicrobiales bacterium]